MYHENSTFWLPVKRFWTSEVGLQHTDLPLKQKQLYIKA